MMAIIEKGSRFSSYEELQNCINEFSKLNLFSLWKRESKTLESMIPKLPSFTRIPPELKYYMIKYACVAGGRVHKKKVTDGSRQTTTIRQNCPAFIYVLISSDKKFLEVKNMNLTHNHVLSAVELTKSKRRRRSKKNLTDSQPSSTVMLPSDIAASSEPVVVHFLDENSELVPSYEGYEEILTDQNISCNEQLDESQFLNAVLEKEVDLLLETLKEYPDLINTPPSPSSRKTWETITEELNFKGSGVWKSTTDLQQKWAALKSQAKKKYMAIQEARFSSEARGNIRPLTELDKKILSLLGVDFTQEQTQSEFCGSLSTSTLDAIAQAVNQIATVNGSANYIITTANETTTGNSSTTVHASVNSAENNQRKRRAVERVGLTRQKVVSDEQTRGEELLALKRESVRLKRQTLLEHRKTNALLERILQIQSQQ